METMNQLETVTPLETRETADTGILCPACLDTLTPRGDCLNVGSCDTADRTAARRSVSGATMKAAAWTVSGGVD
jgi:hypothetical protein